MPQGAHDSRGRKDTPGYRVCLRQFHYITKYMHLLINIKSDSLYVRIYDHTAIIIVVATANWQGANDQINEQTYTAILVAIKKDGRWQFVATHWGETTKGRISKTPPSQ